MASSPWKPAVHVAGACIWLFVVACAGTEHAPAPQSPAAHPQMPNPAARKCLEDGYELEPVLADGVPIDHDCVDKTSGKRCKVWDYFRGNCRLSEMPQR